jgi:hypothetical protein
MRSNSMEWVCMCKCTHRHHPVISLVAHLDVVALVSAHSRTTIVEFLREAVGVVGRELSEELALNSSELRLSEASLSPLLLSSQLQDNRERLAVKTEDEVRKQSSILIEGWHRTILPEEESLGFVLGLPVI